MLLIPSQIKQKKTKNGNYRWVKKKSMQNPINSKQLFSEGLNALVIYVKKNLNPYSIPDKDNTVHCAHCQGYYNRRKLSQHLHIMYSILNSRQCKDDNTALDQKVLPIRDHSIQV